MVDSSHSRDRRGDILEAAIQEFSQAGWAAARMERIAARARVNKQLLFHYFGSKDGLFAAALESVLERAALEPLHPESPAETIRALLARLQGVVQEGPGLAAIIATATTDRSIPEAARQRVERYRDQLRQRLRAAVEDGQRRGYFRDDIIPDEIATFGLAAAFGAGLLGLTTPMANVGRLVTDVSAWR
jgi:AcrR family transcriptional regulator